MDIIYAIWLRNLKRFLRSRSRTFGILGMPLFFLLILGFGLNSIVNIPGMKYDYVEFIVPGIVAMAVLFTSMFSGVQIIWDRQFGFLKETLVAPVSRMEIMLGQTLSGVTISLIQGLIILFLSLLIGVNITGFVGFLIALLFMILTGLCFTALGVAIASKMEDIHGFQLITNFVTFPIFALSGAVFPINSLPPWMKSLTLLDPLTYGVEGIRYGLLGTSYIDPVTAGLVLSVVTVIIVIVGAYLFRKTPATL